MDKDLELMHDSIHAEYQQALTNAQWALAQANARNKVKDRIISELTGLLETATTPAEPEN